MTTARARPARAPAGVADLRRALLEDIAALVAKLPATRSLAPPEVHDLRKRLKRARASLALLRPSLEEGRFRGCDRGLRAAGKTLARARDAAALARTHARMRSRADLAQPKDAGEAAAGRRGAVFAASRLQVAQTRRHLQAARRELGLSALQARGWNALGPGFRKVYRRGRRRVPAVDDPTSHSLHAWRRHAKRYWHVLEVFEPVNARRLEPLARQARRLSDLLGEEHDLALLEAKLKKRRRRAASGDARLLREIPARRRKLAARAVRLGRRLYAARPRDVEAALHRDWDRWIARRRGRAGQISETASRRSRAMRLS